MVTQIYDPITNANKEDANESYAEVQTNITRTWKQTIQFVVEEWNVSVGNRKENIVGLYGLGNKNKTGEGLIKNYYVKSKIC